MLHEWRRGSKVVLAANPGYREEYFPSAVEGEPPAVAANKEAPIVGRAVHHHRGEPAAPVCLQLEADRLSATAARSHEERSRTVSPLEYARQKVTFDRGLEPAFTMRISIAGSGGGGYRRKIALRRAIAMAYDIPAIQIIRQGDSGTRRRSCRS
jgi:hypothetical protein